MTVEQCWDLGLWDKYCEWSGCNPYAINEGQIEKQDIIEFDSEFKKKEPLKYIGFHCPYCGKKIFMNALPNVDEENFEEKYYCSCGENSRIQYDFITGKLNIGAIIEVINK
jgi:DNA-directed RNA polymerase subunit RPC12/RpoP